MKTFCWWMRKGKNSESMELQSIAPLNTIQTFNNAYSCVFELNNDFTFVIFFVSPPNEFCDNEKRRRQHLWRSPWRGDHHSPRHRNDLFFEWILIDKKPEKCRNISSEHQSIENCVLQLIIKNAKRKIIQNKD